MRKLYLNIALIYTIIVGILSFYLFFIKIPSTITVSPLYLKGKGVNGNVLSRSGETTGKIRLLKSIPVNTTESTFVVKSLTANGDQVFSEISFAAKKIYLKDNKSIILEFDKMRDLNLLEKTIEEGENNMLIMRQKETIYSVLVKSIQKSYRK